MATAKHSKRQTRVTHPRWSDVISLIALAVSIFALVSQLRATNRDYRQDSNRSVGDAWAELPGGRRTPRVLYSQPVDADSIERATSLAKEAVSEDPQNPEAYAVLGTCLWLADKREAAKNSFEQSVLLGSESTITLRNYALVLSFFGRNEEAIVQLRKAIRLDHESAHARLLLARIFEEEGKKEKAFEQYKILATQKPRTAEDFFLVGQANINIKRYYPGLDFIERAIEMDPGNPAFYVYLGSRRLSFGNLTSAAKYYKRALAIVPENPTLHFQVGSIAYLRGENMTGIQAMGQYSLALLAFQKAAKLDPRMKDAQYFMGKTYARLLRWEDAYNAYHRALSLGPNDPEILKALSQIAPKYSWPEEATKLQQLSEFWGGASAEKL